MAERERWEYLTRFVWMDHDNRDKSQRGWKMTANGVEIKLSTALDALGAKGWELVGMMQYAQRYGGFGATGGVRYLTYEYIFKRRLTS